MSKKEMEGVYENAKELMGHNFNLHQELVEREIQLMQARALLTEYRQRLIHEVAARRASLHTVRHLLRYGQTVEPLINIPPLGADWVTLRTADDAGNFSDEFSNIEDGQGRALYTANRMPFVESQSADDFEHRYEVFMEETADVEDDEDEEEKTKGEAETGHADAGEGASHGGGKKNVKDEDEEMNDAHDGEGDALRSAWYSDR